MEEVTLKSLKVVPLFLKVTVRMVARTEAAQL